MAVLVPLALAGCPEPQELQEAAEGGWLVESQRRCLFRHTRRRRHAEEASRLLLADARARSDAWAWRTLAREHVRRFPSDGDLWLDLLADKIRHDRPADVVAIANDALAARKEWATGDDPRVVALMRARTYAALHARDHMGLEPELVRYAEEWLDAASERAPAVAWGALP